jgi:hypothetical protein
MKQVKIQHAQNVRLLYVVPRLESLRIPAGAKDFSLLQKSSLAQEHTQPSIQGGVVDLFPEGYSNRGVKQLLTSIYCHD